MDRIELQATTRDVLGKKTKLLRREGITPANLYGHNVESTALSVDTSLLKHTIAQAGTSSLISLKIKGEKSPRMILIRGFQRDPLGGELLHADFYQVKMAEKTKVEVPLSLVGESPAVKDLDGILLQNLNSVEVECLPADIPHEIEVDLSVLVSIDQAVHVSELPAVKGVTILTDPEKAIAVVTGRRVEVIEEEVPEEEAVAEEAAEEKEEEAPEAAEEPESE